MRIYRRVQTLLEPEQRRALTEIRERIQARHGVLSGDFVAEMRKERDRDNERVWRGEP
jgi:hypothetical protein